MLSLVCQIEEVDNNTNKTDNKTSKQVILSIKNDNNIIISNQCNIQDLCEQLPMLMKKLMSAVEDKNFIKEIVLYFDVNKNLTTKRVLMSFMLGFFDNKIKVIEH